MQVASGAHLRSMEMRHVVKKREVIVIPLSLRSGGVNSSGVCPRLYDSLDDCCLCTAGVRCMGSSRGQSLGEMTCYRLTCLE